jgi:hypothetical protein
MLWHIQDGNEVDDNVPTAEGVRQRSPDDVCEGSIAVQVGTNRHAQICCVAIAASFQAWLQRGVGLRFLRSVEHASHASLFCVHVAACKSM